VLDELRDAAGREGGRLTGGCHPRPEVNSHPAGNLKAKLGAGTPPLIFGLTLSPGESQSLMTTTPLAISSRPGRGVDGAQLSVCRVCKIGGPGRSRAGYLGERLDDPTRSDLD
jgi:hypothetical protein